MKQVKLNERDHYTRLKYLERKLTLDPTWLTQDDETKLKAENAFKVARGDKVTLQAWCEKWLNEAQKKQLNDAVRAKRSRQARKRGTGTKSVTLSHEAWLILSENAKRDGVTLSKWITRNLEIKP